MHRENEKLTLQWVDIANTAQARGQDQHMHSWNVLAKESPTVWDCPKSTTTASPQEKQQARSRFQWSVSLVLLKRVLRSFKVRSKKLSGPAGCLGPVNR